jgi:hypothetical protein
LGLTAVAKALRQVAEGKAAAQAEAAEWKRKYELEKAVNAHKHHSLMKGTHWSLYSLLVVSWQSSSDNPKVSLFLYFQYFHSISRR